MAADTQTRTRHVAAAGLPDTPPHVDEALRRTGIDPERLSVVKLGHASTLSAVPSWAWRFTLGLVLAVASRLAAELLPVPAAIPVAALELAAGLLILMAACELLVTATERLAARFHWNHYTAGTLAEILSTLPELVVIAFIVPVSPATAFVIALITIYNNALVFSLYSFFLPKDRQGKFLMPVPITEAGTQILIAGGAMGLILGLVMLTFNASSRTKSGFSAVDLVFVSAILLLIFSVYLYKLMTSYAKEETEVRASLSMSKSDIDERLSIVYEDVAPGSMIKVTLLFLAGVSGAVIGGHEISAFAEFLTEDLRVNPVLAAMILALFAGISEYLIIWHSHRKREYGIALANAFGGITQVMFLVLPYTLLCIATFQLVVDPAHPDLPIGFSLANILLLLFLFPTFYTLSSLLEEDHTLGILDTAIMFGIFLLLVVVLVTYGGGMATG